ncbi:MAG: hypothetical protein K2Q06_03540 [Parvularculaceae bacterium]|nr:hypothetical protein [Parvularculaceae bacterium]
MRTVAPWTEAPSNADRNARSGQAAKLWAPIAALWLILAGVGGAALGVAAAPPAHPCSDGYCP